MLPNYTTLVPAYGRDYKSGKEAQAAFENGVDFKVATYGPNDGQICSIRDFATGSSVNLRFKRLTGVKVVKVVARG